MYSHAQHGNEGEYCRELIEFDYFEVFTRWMKMFSVDSGLLFLYFTALFLIFIGFSIFGFGLKIIFTKKLKICIICKYNKKGDL